MQITSDPQQSGFRIFNHYSTLNQDYDQKNNQYGRPGAGPPPQRLRG